MRTYLNLITPPTAEPVALATLKRHLRQGAPADDLTESISIAPGSHAIIAAYGLAGSSVAVTNKQPIFLLEAGTCGVGGSVAVKLQDSNDDITWTDVTGGAFTTVAEANDNAVQELVYTGIAAHVRAVATVAGAACEFGVTALLFDPVEDEDTLLLGYLKAAREYCEEKQEKSCCTQTWELVMDDWPEDGGDIKLERGPWLSVASVKYTDVDGTETTLTATTDYATSLSRGIIRLAYGKTWPTVTLAVIDPIKVRFTAGMATVPQRVQSAILLVAAWQAEHRGDDPHDMDAAALNAVHRLLKWDSKAVPFA